MPWARHGVRLKADAPTWVSPTSPASTSLFRRLVSLALLGEARRAQKNAFWSLGGRACTCSRLPPSLSLSLARCPARRRCPFGRPDDSRHVRWPGVETDAHSECLPEEVVAAGGSAHVVTFARLGAFGTTSHGWRAACQRCCSTHWHSRVRTVATLAEAGEFALFPLDANKLHIIAGALRIGNYRSAGAQAGVRPRRAGAAGGV